MHVHFNLSAATIEVLNYCSVTATVGSFAFHVRIHAERTGGCVIFQGVNITPSMQASITIFRGFEFMQLICHIYRT